MFKIPTITKNLLIINVLAFMAMLVLQQVSGIDLNDVLGLHFFMASNFHVYQLVTYLFMHGGWEHIILNMFMLWMFGAVIEQVLGQKRFLFYYIFCGIGAGILQEIAQFFWVYYMLNSQHALSLGDSFAVMSQLSAQLDSLTTVGASGAIYALLLAFGMLFPEEKMFIIPIPIPIKAKWMVIGSIAIELFTGLTMPGSNVAHLAHLGGMVFGFFLIRHWQKQSGYGYGSDGPSVFDAMRARWQQHRNQQHRSTVSPHSRTAARDENPDWQYNADKEALQRETDRILDKIRRSGYDSLTKEEKQTLFDQSKK